MSYEDDLIADFRTQHKSIFVVKQEDEHDVVRALHALARYQDEIDRDYTQTADNVCFTDPQAVLDEDGLDVLLDAGIGMTCTRDLTSNNITSLEFSESTYSYDAGRVLATMAPWVQQAQLEFSDAYGNLFAYIFKDGNFWTGAAEVTFTPMSIIEGIPCAICEQNNCQIAPLDHTQEQIASKTVAVLAQ